MQVWTIHINKIKFKENISVVTDTRFSYIKH